MPSILGLTTINGSTARGTSSQTATNCGFSAVAVHDPDFSADLRDSPLAVRFKWSMALLCRSCLPYLLLSTTSRNAKTLQNFVEVPQLQFIKVRRQFLVVEQKLIPMVLLNMGIPQLHYSHWWSMSLLAARVDSSLSLKTVEIPQLRLVVFSCLVIVIPVMAQIQISVVSYHRDSPAAVH